MVSFGVDLHPVFDARTVLEEAQLADRLGYDIIWIADSQLIWREAFSLLGAIAVTTERAKLGTGVTNPVTRRVAVLASAFATLQELSGGRMQAGIGVGDSALRTMGAQPATMGELELAISTLRALCGGQAVGNMRLNAGGEGRCPPIYMAGAGPKMLALAGRVADGVILSGRAQNDDGLLAMLACVREGRANRLPATAESFQVIVGAGGAVHADRRAAHLAVRPHVARGLLTARWNLTDETRRASEQVKVAYDYSRHMDPAAPHAALIPENIIPQFAVAGTAADCIAQIQGLVSAGVDAIVIQPYAAGNASRSETMVRFARDVMSAFRH